MTPPSEATVLRWGATVAFVGCFTAGLYLLGVSAAPWIALLVGALVFGTIMARLWVQHLDNQEARRARQERQRPTSRLIVPDDDD